LPVVEDHVAAFAATRLRDPKAALKAASSARTAILALPLADQSRVFKSITVVRKLSKKRVSAISQYTIFAKQHGTSASQPISLTAAQGYLTWCALGKGNGTHALSQTLSTLRNAAKAMSLWSVTEAGDAALNAHIVELQRMVPSAPKKTEPIPAAVLLGAVASLMAAGTTSAAQTARLIIICSGIAARGKEVAGTTGMRVTDFTPTHKGLGYEAVRGKKSPTTLQGRPRAVPHLRPQFVSLCATRAFLEQVAAIAKDTGITTPTGPLWRVVDCNDKLSDMPLTLDAADSAMKMALLAAGAAPAHYSRHWARYAGSNFLKWDNGLKKEVVSELLDWASGKEGPGGRKGSVFTRVYMSTSVKDLLTTAHDEAQRVNSRLCCRASARG
jgi:hypothetical protein